jgi:hypothetical protein
VAHPHIDRFSVHSIVEYQTLSSDSYEPGQPNQKSYLLTLIKISLDSDPKIHGVGPSNRTVQLPGPKIRAGLKNPKIQAQISSGHQDPSKTLQIQDPKSTNPNSKPQFRLKSVAATNH